MFTSRRSLFALIAGTLTIFAVRAKADAPAIIERAAEFPFPRGLLVPMCVSVVDGEVICDSSQPCIEQISTGSKLVPLHSIEGQACLHSRMALPDEPWPEYPRGKLLGRWISTGNDFVLQASPEGQAIRII
jgi:hypothetical protein